MATVAFLKRKANQIRKDLLRMICTAKTGHTGSSLSCADILTTLFYDVMDQDPQNPKKPDRDRFILSKGHAVEGYYCILGDLGYFPKEALKTFSQFGSPFIGHPNNKVPGVEMNTGSLGHGLSISVGMALAAKMKKEPWRVFTLMGDGEQAEGSVWEAAMAGAHFKLDNLIGVIDRNKLQISGCTEDVMALEPLEDKWRAFGWHTVTVDGHDFAQMQKVLRRAPEMPGKPTLIVANTTKGKAVSYMENVAGWHHGSLSEEQLAKALQELDDLDDLDEPDEPETSRQGGGR